MQPLKFDQLLAEILDRVSTRVIATIVRGNQGGDDQPVAYLRGELSRGDDFPLGDYGGVKTGYTQGETLVLLIGGSGLFLSEQAITDAYTDGDELAFVVGDDVRVTIVGDD